MYHWYDGDKALDEDKGLVCFKRCPPSEAPTLHTSSFHRDRKHRLCKLPQSSSPHRYKCSMRRGLKLKGRHGMFFDADEAFGVETAEWRAVNTHWNLQSSPHTSSFPRLHPTDPDLPHFPNQGIHQPPSAVMSTSCIPRHLSPTWEKKTFHRFLHSFLSLFHLLWPPPAWQHYPLNERIWLNKLNLKPKTGKLATFVGHLPFSVRAAWFTRPAVKINFHSEQQWVIGTGNKKRKKTPKKCRGSA